MPCGRARAGARRYRQPTGLLRSRVDPDPVGFIAITGDALPAAPLAERVAPAEAGVADARPATAQYLVAFGTGLGISGQRMAYQRGWLAGIDPAPHRH